jgi:adenylate cyclase
MDWIPQLIDLISANEATLSGLAALLAIIGVIFALGFRATALLRDRRRNAPPAPLPPAATTATTDRFPHRIPAGAEPSLATSTPTSMKPSVAVLPFRNISGEKGNDYLAEGMTEDLITGLSLGRHLSVKSRSSTFGLKDEASDVGQLGRDLGVGYVVEGSIRPVAGNVRITVQLITASTGDSLWAERFDRPADKLFDIQDEVIAGITSTLGANIAKAESLRASSLTPHTLSAWEAVQRASFYRGAEGNSEEETNQSIEELRSAVENEPDYAYAHSMLAWILHYRAINGLSDNPGADFREAAPHLKKGLSLAPDDPFNLSICGGAFGYVGEFEKAEQLCQRALAIDPHFADAYFNLGSIYTLTGRFEEADAALDRVEEMAPKGPMSRYYDWYRSMVRASEGQFEEAARLQRATIDRSPSYTTPYLHLAISLAELGRSTEASETLGRVLEVNPRLTPDRARVAVGAHPDPDIRRRRIELLEELWSKRDART